MHNAVTQGGFCGRSSDGFVMGLKKCDVLIYGIQLKDSVSFNRSFGWGLGRVDYLLFYF